MLGLLVALQYLLHVGALACSHHDPSGQDAISPDRRKELEEKWGHDVSIDLEAQSQVDQDSSPSRASPPSPTCRTCAA